MLERCDRLSEEHNFVKPNDERALQLMDHAARDDGACRLDDLFVRLDRRVAAPAAFVQRSGALCPPCMERLLALSEEECVEMRRRLPTFFALFELVGWQ